MKINNFPRFIFFIIVVIFIISFCTNILTSTVFSASPEEYEPIIVSQGDTIWSIASNLGGNTEKNVYEIKKINNLSSSIIYVGQELKVPVSKI